MKNALIITWTGYQDHELVYPCHRLIVAGFASKINNLPPSAEKIVEKVLEIIK